MRGNGVERGILLLTKARELGDLPEQIEGEIYWAEQYVAGVSYFAVNWDLYLSYFRPLCEFAPAYQDSCGKLTEGLAAAASDAFAAADWCLAATFYTELAIVNPNAQLTDGTLSGRIDQTVSACGKPTNLNLTLTPQAKLATPVNGSDRSPATPIPQTP